MNRSTGERFSAPTIFERLNELDECLGLLATVERRALVRKAVRVQ
jgi:hypothetical protein